MIYTAIVTDARKQTRTTSANWSDANILIDINNGQEEVAAIIQRADGDWQWEDLNQSDTFTGLHNIVSGTQTVAITTTYIKIEKIFIHSTATDTTWIELPYNPDKSKFLEATSTNNTGVPSEYTLIGNSIVFDVFPNYSSTNGLKILVQKDITPFGDGTGGTLATSASPGFNPQFHKYLSLYAQREWLEAYEKGNDHLNKVIIRLQKMEKDMMHYYSSKKRGERTNLKSGLSIEEYQ